MSLESNKTLVRRIPLEIANRGDLALADQIIAPQFVNHNPLPGSDGRGPQDVRHLFSTLRSAFPDFRYTLEKEIADGDVVAHQVVAHGTHQGPFLGIPPTGKQATWSELHIVRVKDGRCVEHWGEVDQMGLLQQLGAIPGPNQ